MTTAIDVTDKNGMKHDEKGLFSRSSSSAHPHAEAGHGKTFKTFGELERSLMGIKDGLSADGHGLGHGGGIGASAHHYEPPKPKPVFRIPNVKTDGPAKQTERYVDKAGEEHDTRIDRITDKPVSDEMEDAINRLYRGEEIPMEEIERIPEIRREQKLADAYCTLDEFMHPEDYEDKDEKLNAIYRRFSADTITQATNEALKDGESYPVKQGRELWLVTGLPGSGKSTSFVGPISKANGARVVDSDAIKERMPGFCHGLGAPRVHEQSKSINDRILAESLRRGDNIVYPVLGYNPDYVGDQIDSFRRKGYKVHLVLNELPYSQSLARCLERRLATGRNIPLAMFKKVGDRPSEAYEKLKTKVDTFEKHAGDGIKTELVEKGANRDLPIPRREQAVYSYHGMPLQGIETYHHDDHGNLHFEKPQTNPHAASFAEAFKVSPKKPLYWAKSWLDSFNRHGQHDAQDAADARMNAASSPSVAPFSRIDLPDAFDEEIEGAETAHDLARFHYWED